MSKSTQTKEHTSSNDLKHVSTQSSPTKANRPRQSHKINPLYETPFQDVVTNEYVRGYN